MPVQHRGLQAIVWTRLLEVSGRTAQHFLLRFEQVRRRFALIEAKHASDVVGEREDSGSNRYARRKRELEAFFFELCGRWMRRQKFNANPYRNRIHRSF